ncbi:MAG: pyridoxamine 5'-phosphate oxidase family protein [Caldilineaceae bacterium]|nr:pyridoxamine 5'-phosphate oxidase family protein [Caldilineaceae bacterium]
MVTALLSYVPPEKTGKLNAEELDEFLAQAWNARLATVTPENRPYVVPVWYEYDAARRCFYVVARERSDYVAHLRANPAVALHIADDIHLEHTRVLVEGRAEVALGPAIPNQTPRLQTMIESMARRYMGPDGPRYAAQTMDRPRLLITITPERMQSWTGGEWAERYRLSAQNGPELKPPRPKSDAP